MRRNVSRWSTSRRRPSRLLTAVATACVVATLSLTACSDDAGLVPQTVLQPASLVFYGDSADVTVPDTVVLGLPIVMAARSFGGGCTGVSQTGVVVRGTRIDVHPTVTAPHPAADIICPAILRVLTHPASITYNREGPVTIVVHGRRDPDGGAVSFTRTITIVR